MLNTESELKAYLSVLWLSCRNYITALDNLAVDCMNKDSVEMCVESENNMRRVIEECERLVL